MRNKIKSKELDTLEELHKLEIEKISLIHSLQKNKLLISQNQSKSPAPAIDNFKISKLEIDVTFYKLASLALVVSNVLLINLLIKRSNQVNALNNYIANNTPKNPIGFKTQSY